MDERRLVHYLRVDVSRSLRGGSAIPDSDVEGVRQFLAALRRLAHARTSNNTSHTIVRRVMA